MSSTITKPVRPGTVVSLVGESLPRALPNVADTVAVAFTHGWGPINTPVFLNNFTDFETNFGEQSGLGRDAVLMAFDGGGLPGAGGAGQVVAVRMAGTSILASTKSLQNTTPAAAITLTALFPGTRGNSISFTAGSSDPGVAGNHLFKVLYRGVVVETYSYVSTNIADLANQINLGGNYVSAASIITGVPLAVVTASAMTGGDDGSTLTATAYTNALNALQWQRFAALAFMDLTDPTIQATVLAYVQGQYAANRPFIWVVGGGLDESVATAVTRSTALADPEVVNLGVGSVTDAVLARTLSTSQLAPRIAGLLTARADRQSLTFAKLANITIINGPTPDQYATAINGGVTVLSHATATDAQTRIEKGLTTFTSTVDASRPVAIFSDPRLVNILNLLTRTIKEWGDDNIIGQTPVNDDARKAVQGFASATIRGLEGRGLIIPGTAVVIVEEPTDPDLLDSIPFKFGFQFARTANYVFAQGLIR